MLSPMAGSVVAMGGAVDPVALGAGGSVASLHPSAATETTAAMQRAASDEVDQPIAIRGLKEESVVTPTPAVLAAAAPPSMQATPRAA